MLVRAPWRGYRLGNAAVEIHPGRDLACGCPNRQMPILVPGMAGDCRIDHAPNRLVSQQPRGPHEGQDIMSNSMRQDLLQLDGWSGWASKFDDRRFLDFVDHGFEDPFKGPVKISGPHCVGVVWGRSAESSHH